MLKAKGTTSIMIDEYADICAQIEALTKRKEEIRLFLSQKKQFQEANKSESQEGNLLTISVRKGSEIPPDVQDVLKVFREMGKPELFERVVSVVPKLLKKYIAGEEYESLVKRKADILVWSVEK